ncbi:MAG: type II toxin-antitoxin system PemK/MazF family toxin [Ardenticatenales bacterium]|nr:type II toxin-antitoxin system PemK/MazF family toxin [Ardenticatenales bacterium]
MTDQDPLRRGDVVLLPLPFVTDFAQQKVRPAVVVQNDVGNRYSANVIIVPITSRVPEQDYPVNHRLTVGTAGLDRPAAILAGTILTVPQSLVIRRLGHLPARDLLALDACLRISLGL